MLQPHSRSTDNESIQARRDQAREQVVSAAHALNMANGELCDLTIAFQPERMMCTWMQSMGIDVLEAELEGPKHIRIGLKSVPSVNEYGEFVAEPGRTQPKRRSRRGAADILWPLKSVRGVQNVKIPRRTRRSH
jgi:hypothetical protein